MVVPLRSKPRCNLRAEILLAEDNPNIYAIQRPQRSRRLISAASASRRQSVAASQPVRSSAMRFPGVWEPPTFPRVRLAR
jgi:hypothetical protein